MQQVTGFQMTENQRRTEVVLCSRYDCCSGSHRIPSGIPSRFPGFSRCLLAPCASCSLVGVAPNLKIPGIYCEFSTATACECTCPFFFFLELRVHLCALHSVHNSLLLHLANRASFTCKTDSFSWGHGPDALACKARPSSDQCGTSLSVSFMYLSIADWRTELKKRLLNRVNHCDHSFFPCAGSKKVVFGDKAEEFMYHGC